ncbi:MAG: DUF2281 domain-containing protein [Geitlerinemataceae cyanobacterium]
MTEVEEINEIVRSLPDDRVQEVLLFARTVLKKHELDTDTPEEKAAQQAEWHELVQSMAGAWADQYPDLEEIRAGEVADAPREHL